MLMLGDKYGEVVDAGLLVYLKTGDTLGVALDRPDIRALMMVRNHLASFLATSARLPPMIHAPRQCGRCWHLRTCTLTHAALENGTTESSGLEAIFLNRTAHLTDHHMAYFREWHDMILLEHSTSGAQKEIWTMTGTAREKLTGHCLGALHLHPSEASSSADQSGFSYTFTRDGPDTPDTGVATSADASASGDGRRSLMAVRISEGDTVIVSEEDGRTVALAMGKVTELTAGQAVVTCDSPIPALVHPRSVAAGATLPTLYRLDRDASAFGLKIAMTNISALFCSEEDQGTMPPGAVPHMNRLRELVVDLRPPSFAHDVDRDAASSALTQGTPREAGRLNACQRSAINRALAAQDYALILGMPGTGKTTTITALIQVLVRAGKSVLVTSYTHNAVDNILLKLVREGTEFLRIGNPKRVHPDLIKYARYFARVHCRPLSNGSRVWSGLLSPQSRFLQTPIER
jgi:DNA replication ATP-dependent helicase Dna2